MKEVLQKANDLVDTLQLKIRKAEQAKADADAQLAKANELLATNKALQGHLDIRTKRMQERESAIDTRESLDAMEKRVKGDRDALAAQRAEFEKTTSKVSEALDTEKRALITRKEKLSDAEQRLDEDRRTYKEQLRAKFIKDGWTEPAK